ncbi:MAG: hypothetical protein LBU14_02760 [Candidatus Peribacteria bacterium]|nr:hypothetical protein [Candidatus Peribacteria bacterium]
MVLDVSNPTSPTLK